MKAKPQIATPLLDVLRALLPDSSKNKLKSLIDQGRVAVGGTLAQKSDLIVERGQEVVVGPKASFADEGIRIVYEDRYLVVLDKPPKLLSVATDAEDERTVHAILKQRLGKMVYPVHRLDRDTSGLMMFTYTPTTQEAMKKQFEKHEVSRHYIAMLEGHLETKCGTWKSFLQEDANYRVFSAPTGEHAITHYEVVAEKPTFSCVRFILETGRKNQIRVHASESGHPVIGDKKYGARTNPYKRLCLHAEELHFFHPHLKKVMKFRAALPEMFRHVANEKLIRSARVLSPRCR